jgi:hypothetical protein
MNNDVRLAPTRQRRLPAVLLGGVAAVALLAGCTDAAAGITLAETKASAQLLRNNALAGIPDDQVSGFVEWKDLSKSCADVADDPDGLMRSWYSSGVVPIAPLYITETATIMKDLAASYEQKGWSVAGDDDSRVLTKPGSSSTITLTVVPITGQLRIESEGPCVATGGPDSDEVKLLENS